MRSIGTGGVTIVMIITLIFSSFIGKDHKVHTQLVGTEVEEQVVQCAPADPCPAFRLILRTEIRP